MHVYVPYRFKIALCKENCKTASHKHLVPVLRHVTHLVSVCSFSGACCCSCCCCCCCCDLVIILGFILLDTIRLITFLASCRLEEARSIGFPFTFLANGWSSSDEKSDTELANVLFIHLSETLQSQYAKINTKIWCSHLSANKHCEITNCALK